MTLTKLKQLLSRRQWQVGLALVLVLLAATGTWRYLAKKNGNGGYVTARVEYGEIAQTISASGTVEPVQAVTLTFKSQGYVEKVNVHVGDRVKAGQVLAEEKQTDLQHAYEQAQASLTVAQANYDKLVATKPQEIAQLNAQLELDKIALDNAKATLDQNQALYEAGVISKAELESSRESYQSALAKYQSDQSNLIATSHDADLRIALANLQTARSNLEQARENLDNARIIAPFDGYVAEINGNVGQWTGGGAVSSGSSSGSSGDSGQFYIYLSSTELQLSAKINEADISKVKTGQKVTFTVDTYPDKTFTGKIAYLAPMATTVNNVQMFDAKISIDDYSLLKSGLPASIKIIVDSASHVLTVPQEALSFARTYMVTTAMSNGGNRRYGTQTGDGDGSRLYATGTVSSSNRSSNSRTGAEGTSSSAPASATGSGFVVVMQNGKPRLQRVETGISDDLNVEIKSGLQEGDTIIVRQLTATGTGSSSDSRSGSGQRSSSGMPGMGIPGMGPGPAGGR